MNHQIALGRRHAVVALALLGTIYACSDNPAGPEPEVDGLLFSGVVTSSLWNARDGQLAYGGSTSGSVVMKKGANGRTTTVSDARSVELAPAVSSAMQDRLRLLAPTTRPVAGMLQNGLDVAGSTAELRRSLARTVNHRFIDKGKHYEARIVEDPRPGKRAPVAMMLFEEGRPVSLHEYSWAKHRDRWIPEKSRLTLYDASGKAHRVEAHDFSALDIAVVPTARVSGSSLRRMGVAAARLVQPDALYAADCSDLGQRCVRELLLLAAATTAWSAGVLAEAAAAAACVGTLITCPAFIAANAFLAGLDLALGVALGDYYNCKQSSQAPGVQPAALDCLVESPQSGGGGGGGPGENCVTEIWVISYDGGLTWEYFTSVVVCTT